MKNLSFEAYKDFYRKNGKTIDQIQKSKREFREDELQRRYDKYLIKLLKQKVKRQKALERSYENNPVKRDTFRKGSSKDPRWLTTQKKVWERDGGTCQLSIKLAKEDYFTLKENSKHLFKRLDCCHVLPKGAYPELYYDIDNIVLLNRYSHNCLDTLLCPIRGKSISKEDQENYWKFIIGEDSYQQLIDKIAKLRYSPVKTIVE